jgi:hypothetical protein
MTINNKGSEDVGATPTTSTIDTLSRRAQRVVMLPNAGNERFESSSVSMMGVN